MSERALLKINGVKVQPFAYRVADAGKMLGVGRSTIFEMIRAGTLEARKIGAATVVTHDSLERVFQAAELSDATKRARAAGTVCTALRSAPLSRPTSTP